MNLEQLREIAARGNDECNCDPYIQHSDDCAFWKGTIAFHDALQPETVMLMIDVIEAAYVRHEGETCNPLAKALEALTKHLEGSKAE